MNHGADLPDVQSLLFVRVLIVASDRQHIRQILIGVPTVNIQRAFAEGEGYRVVYILDFLCGPTAFQAEYRSHCLLRGSVYVNQWATRLPACLDCQVGRTACPLRLRDITLEELKQLAELETNRLVGPGPESPVVVPSMELRCILLSIRNAY